MATNFADRLIEAIRRKGTPACVGIDPVLERLPAELREPAPADDAEAARQLRAFGAELIRLAAPHVAIVKINIAYFERYHAPGVGAYEALVAEAQSAGLLVIGDVKRGDVGHTAEMYARAHLSDSAAVTAPDAITISAYFGWDGVKPFAEAARETGRGLFALVRTSNPSAAALQDLALADGRKVHELLAGQVNDWAEASGTIGVHGFSSIGAVVATRSAADAGRLRERMPRSIFLVPGYGAQGGRAEDFAPYFRPDGMGALVAAGRSVMFAFDEPARREQHGDDWRGCIDAACRDFVADLARVARVSR